MNTSSIIRHLSGLLLLLFSISLLPRTVQAVLIDVTVTGEVTEITNVILETEFSIGDSMSATFTYDQATPSESSLISTQALYLNAITGGDFSVGSYAGTVFGGNINIANDDPAFHDDIIFRGFATGAAIGTLTPRFFGILLNDSTKTTLNSLALPQSTSDVSGFPDQAWGLSFGGALSEDPPAVFGMLISLELKERVSIPEPTTLTLLGLGLAVIGYRRQSRKKTT